MAATLATLRAQVKDFADLQTVSTFDTDIDGYVASAIENLPPRVLVEADPDTTQSVAADTRYVSLPTGVYSARRVEAYDSSVAGDGYSRIPSSDYIQHGTKIWFNYPFDTTTQIRIWPLVAPTVHATVAASTTLPSNLNLAVVYAALSQLYASLAGNKRKYNIYVGAAGSMANRDMKDSIQLFADLAQDEVERNAPVRGS